MIAVNLLKLFSKLISVFKLTSICVTFWFSIIFRKVQYSMDIKMIKKPKRSPVNQYLLINFSLTFRIVDEWLFSRVLQMISIVTIFSISVILAIQSTIPKITQRKWQRFHLQLECFDVHVQSLFTQVFSTFWTLFTFTPFTLFQVWMLLWVACINEI